MPELAVGQPDDVALALDQLVPQHRAELERRGDEVAQDLDALLAGRSCARPGTATLAVPELEGLVEPGSQVRRRAVARRQSRLVEDEVRIDIGTERCQAEAPTSTR